METPSSPPGVRRPVFGVPEAQGEAARRITGFWWLWLLTGVAWIIAALVVLQFDRASITTVGVLIGLLFVVAGIQQIWMATVAESMRWFWALFGGLFIVAGIICFINPEDTFAGMADILGFLFLTVGVWWIIQAFIEKEVNPAWWLGLLSGVAMVVLAFWTSGQFFIEKAYTLLVFAGIWALMQGIRDMIRAFQVRSARDLL
jgi:uncharacterized membrane protein HdeD (DUF308 family)